MSNLKFAARSLFKSFTQRPNCPYCGQPTTELLQRKHVLIQLRKCGACKLQFRFPKDDSTNNLRFYQASYREDTVTNLPEASEIPRHIAENFKGVGRDITDHLRTIREIAPTGKLLDYGSSWGYCVYQFSRAGYDASGFEISRSRVEYGQKTLGVALSHSITSFPDCSFDVIYSAHCLEHIPNPDIPLSQFRRLLKPGGNLFIYVPNCSGQEARKHGVQWGPMIGEKHVLALNAEFFNSNLPKYGFRPLFASSPYHSPPKNYGTIALDGDELLVAAVREPSS